MKPTQIAYIPFAPVLGDSTTNLASVIALVREAKKKGTPDIILFPELALSGYLLENLAFSSALTLPDDLPEELLELSHDCEIHIGTLIKEDGKIYNAQVALYQKQIHHIHRKIYLPSYGLFDESRYFTAGEKLSFYEGKLGRSAILICEDAFHPALTYALYAANVRHVFVPSCSPARGVNREEEGEDPVASFRHWKKRLEVYAESFGQFYYYLNRSGCEDGVFFDGRGLLVSPIKTRETAPFTRDETIFFTEVDLTDMESATTLGGPHVDENWEINLKFIREAHKFRNE